jgi:hypothetical protein
MEETEVPIENHRPVASHWQILSIVSTCMYGDKYSLNSEFCGLIISMKSMKNWYLTNNNEFSVVQNGFK